MAPRLDFGLETWVRGLLSPELSVISAQKAATHALRLGPAHWVP